jgi:hypothetical protein
VRAWWVLLALAGCPHPGAVAPIDAAGTVRAAPLDPAVRAALEAGAADPDVGVRRRALATLIAADPAPGGGGWGPRGRYDPSVYVQRAAMVGLGERAAEPEARALLRAVVDTGDANPWTRGAAALALVDAARAGRIPAADAATDLPRLSSAVASVHAGSGAALLLAAAEAGDAHARAALAELVAAGNLPMELWFLHAVGRSGEPDLVAPLTRALDGVEPEIRLAVAAALHDLGGPAGTQVLADGLRGEDEDAALEALEYLQDIPGAGTDALLQGARAGSGIVAHVAGLMTFGRGGGDLHGVIEAIGADDIDVQLAGVRAAGARLRAEPALDGGDRLRTALATALPDADPSLQLALIDALAGSARSADRAALTARLDDESMQVRVAAAAALAAPVRP